LDDSDDRPDEDVDEVIMDLETPGRDEETEVGTRDGNASDNEVMAEEETDDEGAG